MELENKMDRRGFFKRSLAKVATVGSEYVEQKVTEKAKGWIRPPFAKAEVDFLLDCSRCGDCIDACPHQVIFPLPVRRGAEVAATPAMDIVNKACHLCSDWPCVHACHEKALAFPIEPEINSQVAKEQQSHNPEVITPSEHEKLPEAKDCPPMASATVNESLCMPYSGPECGACKGSCPIPDTLIWKNEKPSINLANCLGCGLCREACITDPKAIDISALHQEILAETKLSEENNV